MWGDGKTGETDEGRRAKKRPVRWGEDPWTRSRARGRGAPAQATPTPARASHQAGRRRGRLRFLVALLLIVAAATGLGLWLRASTSSTSSTSPTAEPKPAPAKVEKEKEKETTAEFTRIFIVGRQNGIKQWEFRANQVQVLQDRSGSNEEYVLKAIRDGVIYRDGKPYLRFEAGMASYDRVRNDFSLTEGLTVRSTSGDWMKTTSVFWDAAQEKLIGRAPVEMSLKGTSVKAPSWEVDVKAEVLEAHGGVVFKGDTVEGRMEGIRYDFRKKETEFLGLEELNLLIEKKDSKGQQR